MPVVKEYRCLAHGNFEGVEPRCPFGCETAVERTFLTAPGAISGKTKGTDATLERLARRFGFTDMSNRNGSVGNSKRTNKVAGLDFSPQWRPMPKGDKLEDGKIISVEGSQGGADAAAKSFGTQPVGDEITATRDVPTPTGKRLPKPKAVPAASWGTQSDLDQAVHSA